MTDEQLKALKTELAKPDYADLIAKGNDAGIVDILNAVQTDPSFAVPLNPVPVANFGNVMLTARLGVFQLKDAQKQAFYSSMFTDLLLIMLIAGTADLGQQAVSGFIQQAIADGLVSQDEVNAAVMRQGSIAEKLLSRTAALSDVSFVLRGTK